MRVQLLSILDCRTRRELAEHLGVPLSTLTFYAYGNGNRYRRFTIAKKSGGQRVIEAPVGSLLQIQRKLAKSLENIYHSPAYVQGFVQEGSIAKNANYHLGKRHILNIDLSDFFPSITASRIIGLLKSPHLGLNNEVASAIASLACSDNKLPQGAPTSPILSNMISLRLDHQLYELAKLSRATYTRYADDITFSTNAKAMPVALVEDSTNGVVVLGAELLNIIKKNNFVVNPEKTRMHSDQQAKYVTGVKVNKKLNLRKRYIRQVRSMVNAYEKYGPELAQQDFINLYGGNGRDFEKVLRGKLAHLKNVKGENDLIYAKLYNRFIRREGKNRLEVSELDLNNLSERIFVVKSSRGYGTGFILDGKWLVTCDHVVDDDKVISYFSYKHSRLLLSHRYADTREAFRSHKDKYDLIAFPIDSTDSFLQSVSFDSAPSSEFVIADKSYKTVGFPLYQIGDMPSIPSVHVQKVEPQDGFSRAYVDKRLLRGQSGSPVLNKSSQVVGLVCRGAYNQDTGEDLVGNSFLPIQDMRVCFNDFRQQYQSELHTILDALTQRSVREIN